MGIQGYPAGNKQDESIHYELKHRDKLLKYFLFCRRIRS